MKIKGTVRYINLETGFWGIETPDGQKYIPINMPEQLKHDGKTVEVKAKSADGVSGLHMWGKYVDITSFKT